MALVGVPFGSVSCRQPEGCASRRVSAAAAERPRAARFAPPATPAANTQPAQAEQAARGSTGSDQQVEWFRETSAWPM